MTIKELLQSYESEIVILVAIAVALIIAVKVISAFIAGARLRAAQAQQAAAAPLDLLERIDQTRLAGASPAASALLASVTPGASGLAGNRVEAAADAVVAVINNYRVSSGDFSLTNVDVRTAALVMAIVADESGIPLEELQFKSIKPAH